MVLDRPAFSRMPSYEDCIPDESKAKSSEGSSSGTRFEGTVPRDLVVNPSFDDIDDRGPAMEHRSDAEARTSLPSGYKASGHSRNLSEHFYESAKISKSDFPNTYSQEESRGVGQKFRRTFSGDVSNPPDAHRRINSIGTVAPIVRRPYLHDRQHQRVDSAGLDILTAAVDASQEELADAAGHLVSTRTHHHFDAGGGTRRSTPEMTLYDHSSSATPGVSTIHHHRYPSGPSAGYYAPPGYGYPSPYYGPPSFRRTLPGAPPPPSGGYPVQYARGPDPYGVKPSQGSLQHQGNENPHEDPGKGRSSSYKQRRDHTGPMYDQPGVMIPPAPVHPSHWRGSSTGGSAHHGVQSFVGSMDTGEGTRPLHTTHQSQTSADHGTVLDAYHHRKSSSTFSWAQPSSLTMGGSSADFGEHPLKRHHRSTSSSVSFLGLDVAALGDGDAMFLKNLHSSNGVNAPTFETKPLTPRSSEETPSDQSQDDGRSKLASGGTSKRVRRKCNVEGCLNRVVQGGLCINHGAKRKHCSHPGCTKNVKKAGLCSTHGPARKKCDAEGCTKVAVQGGRCIAHGAKKKLCCVDGCTKQAILSSMCKKHHDLSRHTSQTIGPAGVLGNEAGQSICKPAKVVKKPSHTRGLSLFQEMSAEAVGSILGDAAPSPAASHHHRSTFSRDFANIYEGD